MSLLQYICYHYLVISVILYTFVTMEILLVLIGFALGILVSRLIYLSSKQSNQIIMATFTEIQTSLASLTTSVDAVQTEVTNLKNTAAGSISATDGDTIKTAIDVAVTSLNNIVTPA